MSDDLHELTEMLNQEFLSATAWLKRLNYGVRARVLFLKEETQEHYLGFGKFNGEWSLLHETVYEDGIEEEQLLRHASREFRLLAAGRLNALLSALSAAQTTETARVAEAVETVRRFREAVSAHFTTKEEK
jgi:hypothetical protein